MTAPQLKTCPFCGGEASACPDPNHSTGWDIWCFNGSCEVEPHVWSVHRDTAEMQWNTHPETDRLIAEAVAAERERCIAILSARKVGYETKRDHGGTDFDTHLTLIHTIEAHEWAIAAIREAAIPVAPSGIAEPSREKFLKIYEENLKKNYDWGKFKTVLARYMSSVVETLNGGSSCDLNTELVKEICKEMGLDVEFTPILKLLRSLK